MLLRYYDFVLRSFVYSNEFMKEGPDGQSSEFMQLSNFYKKAHLYCDSVSVDIWSTKNDKNNKPIFRNDIVIVPSGWSGDYYEYSDVCLVEFDIYDGISISLPDDVRVEYVEVITNTYESSSFLDFVKEYKEQFPRKKKYDEYDFHKIFEEYKKIRDTEL